MASTTKLATGWSLFNKWEAMKHKQVANEGEETMKKLMTYFALAVMITTLTALTGLAQGKTRSATINLTEDLLVNDTLVKKGQYTVRVNDETGDLTLLDNKGKTVVATKGRVQELNEKVRYTSVMTTSSDKGRVLTGLRIEGARKGLSLTESANNTVAE